MEHGGEVVVERGVAVFDVAEFVGEDSLQLVAGEVVECAPADGKGEAAIATAEGEGVDAVIGAQDVGIRFIQVGGETEFGDEVDVAAFRRVIVRAGGVGAEGQGLFACALPRQLAPFFVVSGEQPGNMHDKAGDDGTWEERHEEMGGEVAGSYGDEGEANDIKQRRNDKEVAEIDTEHTQPESEVQTAAGAPGAAVFVLKTGGHGGLAVMWASEL